MLDTTDLKILDELSENSRITMKELGEKVHLTGQAVSNRIIRLEEKGIIENYTIKIDQDKLGSHIHALINIYINGINHDSYLTFIDLCSAFILHNYRISGDSCYILEGSFPSHKVLDDFLIKLNKFANYKVSIILKDIKSI